MIGCEVDGIRRGAAAIAFLGCSSLCDCRHDCVLVGDMRGSERGGGWLRECEST